MPLDLLERLHDANFEVLSLFFLRASKKNPEKLKPYIRAMKDNYLYNTNLAMKLRETEKELSTVRTKYLKQIEELTNENNRLKKLTNINKY